MQGAPDGRSVMWLCDIGVWKTALGTGLILLAGDGESPVPGCCVPGKGRIGFVCGWAPANHRVQECFSGSNTQFEHRALAFLLGLALSHPFLEEIPSG